MNAHAAGARDRADACPGTRRVHLAADGAIGRLRFPGGFIPAPVFTTLADLAENFGDGDIHFTSRGNIQIRGIKNVTAFADAVEEAGLVPSPSHDRVRNIIQSPLTGRTGGKTDVHDLVQDFDEALRADDTLATLSGRTLFAFDDGRGDVAVEKPDLGVIALDEDNFELLIGGEPAGIVVKRADVVAAMMAAAQGWAKRRGTAWRIAEAKADVDIASVVLAELGSAAQEVDAAQDSQTAATIAAAISADHQIGWINQDDGKTTLAAGLRFGILPARLARAIAHTQVPVHVTPWYSLMLHDLDEETAEQVVRVFAPNGLIFDRKSTWLRVTACTGRPGCEKSLADTRGDAAHAIAEGRLPDGRIHFSGCERRCGKPKGGYIDYLAVGDGEYEVTAVD